MLLGSNYFYMLPCAQGELLNAKILLEKKTTREKYNTNNVYINIYVESSRNSAANVCNSLHTRYTPGKITDNRHEQHIV